MTGRCVALTRICMEYGQDYENKSPDAPRKRIYHPRHVKIAVAVVVLVVVVWLVFQLR